MLVSLLVTVVSGFNNGVEKIGEDFVGLFVASDGTYSHDEGMAGVVDTGLFKIKKENIIELTKLIGKIAF